MNLIGALDTPTAGDYYIAGQLISTMSDDELAYIRNREIGFVFQTFNLLPRLTALQNVELPLVYASVQPAERTERAKHALAQVDLTERMYHTPSELSGGQRQRVAIARALINAPPVVLADEPTGNLDRRSADTVGSLLLDLQQEQGILLIAVTHSMDLAARFPMRADLVDGQLEPAG